MKDNQKPLLTLLAGILVMSCYLIDIADCVDCYCTAQLAATACTNNVCATGVADTHCAMLYDGTTVEYGCIVDTGFTAAPTTVGAGVVMAANDLFVCNGADLCNKEWGYTVVGTTITAYVFHTCLDGVGSAAATYMTNNCLYCQADITTAGVVTYSCQVPSTATAVTADRTIPTTAILSSAYTATTLYKPATATMLKCYGANDCFSLTNIFKPCVAGTGCDYCYVKGDGTATRAYCSATTCTSGCTTGCQTQTSIDFAYDGFEQCCDNSDSANYCVPSTIWTRKAGKMCKCQDSSDTLVNCHTISTYASDVYSACVIINKAGIAYHRGIPTCASALPTAATTLGLADFKCCTDDDCSVGSSGITLEATVTTTCSANMNILPKNGVFLLFVTVLLFSLLW